MGRTHKDNTYSKSDKKIRNLNKGKNKSKRNINMSVDSFFEEEYDSYKREFLDD